MLLQDKQGHLSYRGSQLVGYGYTGSTSGPFTLMGKADFPAVLGHAENEAVIAKRSHISSRS